MTAREPRQKSFAAMLKMSVKYYRDEEIFLDKERSISYGEFSDDVSELRKYLLANKYRGKKIGIVAANSYEWVQLFFAVAGWVGIIVPLDKELSPKELKNCVDRAKLSCLFYDDSTKGKVSGVSCECLHVSKIKEFTDKGRDISKKYQSYKGDCAALFFTSGTTSGAKIVMLSQKNIVSCAYQSAHAFTLYPSDRYYTMLPLHHTLTLMCAVLVPITNGCSFCFNKSLKDMKRELKYYQPTALVVVPRLLEFITDNIKRNIRKTRNERKVRMAVRVSNLLRKVGVDYRAKLFKQVMDEFGGKLRMVACGGAELDQRIFNFLDDLGFNIYQGYGLTEASPILTIRGMAVKDKNGVGRPLEHVELKIIDPDASGVGEVAVRAPQVMLGYYKDKKATNKILKRGWLYTGDYGQIEKSGNLMIRGRKKNVIISSNGKNIYPEELECLINYSEVVKECVVSAENQKNGVRLMASIVPEDAYLKRQDTPKKIAKLIDDINLELPAYKRINGFEIRKKDFEKTTTLKIKRNTIVSR